MIVWILFSIIIICFLVLFWYFSPQEIAETPTSLEFVKIVDSDTETLPVVHNITHHPTIHSMCNQNSLCGGDLVCDINCHRCKKKVGGSCSSDIDCESHLICHNWICTSTQESDSYVVEPNHITPNKSTKNVQWNDSMNKTYII